MKSRAWLAGVLNGKVNTPAAVCARVLLSALSLLYFAGLKAGKLARKIAGAKTAPCFVISVGNITLGGTGKTPLVIKIASKLAENGVPCAVVTRGYGRTNPALQVIVSDGRNILAGASEGGDEPLLIAEKTRGVPVIADSDRHRGCLTASGKFNAKVVILDDGFQSRYKLDRELDIVALDASNPFGSGFIFPAGTLREPASSLKEADIVFLSKSNQGDSAALEKIIKALAPGALVARGAFMPAVFYEFGAERKRVAPEALKGRHAAAFCAIAEPRSFYKTLVDLSPQKVELIDFPDHHRYTEAEMNRVNEKLACADYAVTTEKDAVKIPKDFQFAKPLLVLEMELVIAESGEFFGRIMQEINDARG